MRITKQQQTAVSSVGLLLYEMEALRDVIRLLREDHADCDDVDDQIFVLENIVDEKLHAVVNTVDFAEALTSDFFEKISQVMTTPTTRSLCLKT
jgi:hypothetical protein